MIPTNNSSDSPLGASSQAAARAVETIVERIRSGEAYDVEQVAFEFPDCQEEIQEILPIALALHRLSGATEPVLHRHRLSSNIEFENENVLLGDFRVGKVLGAGAMGVVYEAEQISLARPVALKILPAASTLDTRRLQRFKNEAVAAARLDHPHIVPVYNVGCDQGIHFIAMKRINGQSLAELIGIIRARRQRQGPPPVEPAGASPLANAYDIPANRYQLVAELALAVADALSYAHELGIVHRDIKPSNLLVEDDRHIWVADFGLARIQGHSELTATGDLPGTPRYMSPEQVQPNSRSIDHRTDIYSLGVTLYELLALRPAIESPEGASPLEMLTQVMTFHPPKLDRIDPSIPRDLATILNKAIAKEYDERYATANEMASDLRRFLQHKPILARPTPIVARLTKWTVRHRSLASTIAAVTAILITTFVVAHLRERSLESDRVRRRVDAQRRLAVTIDNERRTLEYVMDMNQVGEAWESINIDRMQELLNRHLPTAERDDVRGAEWHFYRAASSQISQAHRKSWDAHEGPIFEITFARDGTILASASQDGSAKLWDARDYSLRHTFAGHGGDVNCLAFSPDSRHLVTGCEDGIVRVWNVDTGELLRTWQAHDHINLGNESRVCIRVGYSPDGSMLATSDRQETKLWHADSTRLVKTIPGGGGTFAFHSPLLATVQHSSLVTIWNGITGEQIAELSREGLEPHAIRALAFSKNDRWLIAGTEYGDVDRWAMADVMSQRLTCRRLHVDRSSIDSIDVSESQSNLLAIATRDGRFRVREFDVCDGRGGPYPHGSRGWSVRFTPDDRSIITAGHDGKLHLWDAKCQQNPIRIDRFEEPNSAGPFRLLSDGRSIAHVYGHHVRITDLYQEHSSFRLTSVPGASAIATTLHDMGMAATGPTAVAIWGEDDSPYPGQECPYVFPFQTPIPPGAECINNVEFTPDGHQLLVAAWSTTLLFDTNPPRLVRNFPANGPEEIHSCLSMSPNGSHAIIGGKNGSICSLDLNRLAWSPWQRISPSAITCLRHVSENVIAAGTSDGVVIVWNFPTGKLQDAFETHAGSIRSMDIAADGRTLAVVGRENEIQLWNLPTGRQLPGLSPDKGYTMFSIQFTRDGKHLIGSGERLQQRETESGFFVWQTSL